MVDIYIYMIDIDMYVCMDVTVHIYEQDEW